MVRHLFDRWTLFPFLYHLILTCPRPQPWGRCTMGCQMRVSASRHAVKRTRVAYKKRKPTHSNPFSQPKRPMLGKRCTKFFNIPQSQSKLPAGRSPDGALHWREGARASAEA